MAVVWGAIAAGAGTVLTLVVGPALLAVWPLVALIAWSRVQVGDHTPAQVLAGIALDMVVKRRSFRCCDSHTPPPRRRVQEGQSNQSLSGLRAVPPGLARHGRRRQAASTPSSKRFDAQRRPPR
jgi:hypothetical protein